MMKIVPLFFLCFSISHFLLGQSTEITAINTFIYEISEDHKLTENRRCLNQKIVNDQGDVIRSINYDTLGIHAIDYTIYFYLNHQLIQSETYIVNSKEPDYIIKYDYNKDNGLKTETLFDGDSLFHKLINTKNYTRYNDTILLKWEKRDSKNKVIIKSKVIWKANIKITTIHYKKSALVERIKKTQIQEYILNDKPDSIITTNYYYGGQKADILKEKLSYETNKISITKFDSNSNVVSNIARNYKEGNLISEITFDKNKQYLKFIKIESQTHSVTLIMDKMVKW